MGRGTQDVVDALTLVVMDLQQGCRGLSTRSGRVDLDSAGDLGKAISNAYMADASKVTVDFAEVLFCDSSGLRVLVNAAKIARRREALFEVCNPTRQLLQIASIVGASDLLDLPPPPG